MLNSPAFKLRKTLCNFIQKYSLNKKNHFFIYFRQGAGRWQGKWKAGARGGNGGYRERLPRDALKKGLVIINYPHFIITIHSSPRLWNGVLPIPCVLWKSEELVILSEFLRAEIPSVKESARMAAQRAGHWRSLRWELTEPGSSASYRVDRSMCSRWQHAGWRDKKELGPKSRTLIQGLTWSSVKNPLFQQAPGLPWPRAMNH